MLAPMNDLPEAFVRRLAAILPADALGPVLASFARPVPTALRVNTLLTSPEAVGQELAAAGLRLAPVPWSPSAFLLAEGERRVLTESAACNQGRVYVQNLASQLAPLLLAPRPGEEVLDLAAAPGGKTLQLAALMENRGRIAAVEPVRERFFKLRANLERAGASLVQTYLMDGRAVGGKVPARFDRVLLDAPCSSEARFRAGDPSTWSHWGPRKLKETAHKQRRLLESALGAVKPGGLVLYCTCAFAPEENEAVVDHLLRVHPGAVGLEPIAPPVDNRQAGITAWEGRSYHPDLAKAVRILPDATMSGFFLALLRRTG
jgi:tRNA (cytosine49-C5)-methyltransferase